MSEQAELIPGEERVTWHKDGVISKLIGSYAGIVSVLVIQSNSRSVRAYKKAKTSLTKAEVDTYVLSFTERRWRGFEKYIGQELGKYGGGSTESDNFSNIDIHDRSEASDIRVYQNDTLDGRITSPESEAIGEEIFSRIQISFKKYGIIIKRSDLFLSKRGVLRLTNAGISRCKSLTKSQRESVEEILRDCLGENHLVLALAG